MKENERTTGMIVEHFISVTHGTLKAKWMIFALVVGITIFAFMGMGRLKMDNSNESFFPENDPTIQMLNKFRELFGNDDFVYILVETDDFFTLENIRLVKGMVEELENKVPYAKEVKYIGNVEHLDGADGTLIVSNLIDELPQTEDQIKRLRKKATDEPMYVDNFISEDGRFAGILIECERYPGETVDPRKEITPAVYEIINNPPYASLKTYVVGGPIIDYETDLITAREFVELFLICFVFIIILLFFFGRGLKGIIAPLVVVILSIIWTLGLIGYIGWPLSLMVIMLPVLILCVGIGDSLHVIAEFQDHMDHGMDKKTAMVKSVSKVFLPCLLTTITTMAGFLAFLGTVLKPIRLMGVYCAIGVAIAFVLSIVLIPCIYSFGKHRAAKKQNHCSPRNSYFDRLLGRITTINLKYPGRIVMIFMAITALSLGGYFRIHVETNMIKNMHPNLKVRQDYDFVDAHMGGSMSLEILLDTGKPNGVKSVRFLKQMQTLETFIKAHPFNRKTTSILDTLRKMRQAMHENKKEYYTLPDTQQQASEYIFFYETSGGEELDKQVSFEYEVARMHVRTQSLGTDDVRSFIADVDAFTKANLDASVSIGYTGMMPWVKATSDYMATGQSTCFILAFVAIGMMMIIHLRSFKLGLISMIPNLFPVLAAMGIMGLLDIHMSIILMIFAPVVIGVAVDDTIHFFTRFRQELKTNRSYDMALKKTNISVGRPILFTTIILTTGFCVFSISDLYTTIQFGLLGAYAFVCALFADFFLAASMMLLLKPIK